MQFECSCIVVMPVFPVLYTKPQDVVWLITNRPLHVGVRPAQNGGVGILHGVGDRRMVRVGVSVLDFESGAALN